MLISSKQTLVGTQLSMTPEDTLRVAKNTFSEHCFGTIASTIVVIFSQEQ